MVCLQIPTGRMVKAPRVRRMVQRRRLQRVLAAAAQDPEAVAAALRTVEHLEQDETVRIERPQ